MTLALAAATTHGTWLVQLLLLQQQLPAPHAIVPQAATLSGWLHHALLCRRQPATQTCGGANVVAAGYCRDCRILQPHPNLLSPSSTSISLQQTQQAVRCLGHVANLPGSTMQASHTQRCCDCFRCSINDNPLGNGPQDKSTTQSNINTNTAAGRATPGVIHNAQQPPQHLLLLLLLLQALCQQLLMRTSQCACADP